MKADVMRIMLVVNEFPPEKIAGTAMATQALAENLAAHGHQVLVLVTTPCPPALVDGLEASDYQLLWMTVRPLRGSGIIWRIWQAWRAARRFKPQIIQGQAVSCGLIAAVVGRLLHVPSLCYAQGYDVYESTRWQQRTEIRWGCAWPDKLLAVTRNLADTIGNKTGIGDAQVLPHAFALPERIFTRDEARVRCGLAGDAHVAFSIGRLESFKGHDVLLNAWVGVVQQYPGATLWIAGSGSKKAVLQQQALALGVERNVEFLGHLMVDSVHQHMAAADVFVLPSRSEPFGIVLLEAMAHGLPVIASDVGGIPEVVPENGDTRLVPVEDVQALQAAISGKFSEGFASSQMNRQHALQFEWGRQVGRFEMIYQQLVR